MSGCCLPGLLFWWTKQQKQCSQYSRCLHDKAPNSTISDGQQSIVLAVEELRKNEFFTGAHMLDPWHLLKIVKAKIKGSEITKVAKLAQIERFDGTQLS